MDWKTKISKNTEDSTIIRGYDLRELMKKSSFSDSIFLLLKGSLPTKEESEVFDFLLISSIDHGIEPASIVSSRTIASCGNSLNSSVAGGILSLGDFHGGAGEKCLEMLLLDKSSEEIVLDAVENKKVIFGLGHKVYKEEDPRSVEIFKFAREKKMFGKFCKKIAEIQEILSKKGKKLCINIDGAQAAVLGDFGFNPLDVKAFFIISRTPGICAHTIEEVESKNRVRRAKTSEYEGEEGKSID